METFIRAAYNVFNSDGSAILQLMSVFIVGGLFSMIVGSFGNKNGALMMMLVTMLSAITVIAKTAYGAVQAALRAGGLN